MTLQLLNTTVYDSPHVMVYTPPRYTGSILENVCITGIPEETARNICEELISAYSNDDEIVDYDDDAALHHELMTEILDVIMDDSRKTFFIADESFQIDYQPFNTTVKLESNEEAEKIMYKIHTDYYCTICLEDVKGSENRGVQLPCGEHCVYCKDCITQWLTKSVARCPYCSHEFHV